LIDKEDWLSLLMDAKGTIYEAGALGAGIGARRWPVFHHAAGDRGDLQGDAANAGGHDLRFGCGHLRLLLYGLQSRALTHEPDLDADEKWPLRESL
jgi:hypothetical protein